MNHLGKKLRRHRRNRNSILLVTWLLAGYASYRGGTVLLFGSLALINAYALFLMSYDKRAAKENAFRIPENSLLTTAGLGGSLGAALGMVLFHHKTKHLRFVLLIPIFLLIHLYLLWLLR